MSEAAKKEAAEKKKSGAKTTGTATPALSTPAVAPTINPTGGTLSTAGGGGGGTGSGSGDTGGKIKNITISIEKLIENFTIHTATMNESTDQLKAVVLDTLMGALNDTQLATE